MQAALLCSQSCGVADGSQLPGSVRSSRCGTHRNVRLPPENPASLNSQRCMQNRSGQSQIACFCRGERAPPWPASVHSSAWQTKSTRKSRTIWNGFVQISAQVRSSRARPQSRIKAIEFRMSGGPGTLATFGRPAGRSGIPCLTGQLGCKG